MNNIKSCYIHIPFCKSICSYCDFCKNYYDEKIVSDYLNALEKEIKSEYKNEVLDTLYIGGGTPSSLSIDNLNKLFNIIKIFKLSDNYEFTFECNYEDINNEILNILKENNVNRLSIGIQSFNDKYKNILNRNINKEEMIKVIKLSKKYFNNINIDFMYALPDENINDVKDDIKTFINMNVTHISTYSLIVENHTKLCIDKVKEVNDELQSDMYYYIVDELCNNGYNHYEISNFCKEGYESKHNLTYWNNENYYGFGAGASGFINNIRYDNTKSIFKYINGTTKIKEEILSKKELMDDEIMLNLRKTSGISKKTFSDKYKSKVNEIYNYKKMVENNLLIDTADSIYIPKNKLFVSNSIILYLLETNILND